MDKIDDFRIVRELGRGGMGVVYEAIEEPLGRRVALKILHPERSGQEGMSARFLEEARNVARLSHPSIVRIHRFGKCGEIFYLALEYIDGVTLDRALAEALMPVDRALAILGGLAAALGHAHRAKIVHRDVKPGNIFLCADGKVVLGDFGIAKETGEEARSLTQPGMIVGTPAYMSPEQARGAAISPATDTYALGVVAFEMIAGRVPFTADTAVSLLLKHVNEPPPSLRALVPGVPAAVAQLVDRLLKKDPGHRPADGDALLALIEQVTKRSHEDTPTVAGNAPVAGIPPARTSTFTEQEVTVAAFELYGFARATVSSVLPARAAFLLESWYRLVHQCVAANGGRVDRHVADRVITVFGFPDPQSDHVQRAVRTAQALLKALERFNGAHDLKLRMRAGVACGPVLVGHILEDTSEVSLQGPLMGDMQRLAKTKTVEQPLRVNRAAYRRCSDLAPFVRFEEPEVGEAWAADFPSDVESPSTVG